MPTFSYSPTRAPRDIVLKGNELNEQEEVKRVLKTILELGLVMPHSGFGATLNPDPFSGRVSRFAEVFRDIFPQDEYGSLLLLLQNI